MRDRPGVVLAAVGTALGLVVGLVVGLMVDWSALFPDADPVTSTSVLTGPIRVADQDSVSNGGFELPVYNATSSPVTVRLVGFKGVASAITSRSARTLAPRTWQTVRFATTANCDVASRADGIASARLRVRTTEGSAVRSVPLSGEGSVLLTYYRTICASGDRVTASELAGVWSLDTVYGTNTSLAGHLLFHFERNGTFTADARGHLFERPGPGLHGTFRVAGDLLTYGVRGGSDCLAGDRAHWRVSVLGVDSLSMVWLDGQCPAGRPGDAWVLRRVLTGGGLPD